MREGINRTCIAAAILGILGASSALAGTASKAVDAGSLNAAEASQPITVTIALKLSDLTGAEAMMQRLATAGDGMYGKFLTPAQVEAQFGPNESDVARVIAQLSASGLTVERATSTTLTATGRPATMEQVFHTSLHQFVMPATAKHASFTFRAAKTAPVVPANIASAVRGVIGLNTNPVFSPHLKFAPATLGGSPVIRNPGSTSGVDTESGALTVKDFGTLYDVNPLYAKGITGKGRTVGIVTLANFTPSDVFAYWSSLNLKVNANRLTVINIDGGPGAPSDASGSDETTLDVEQSGGIAPGANIIVYQSPNTDQGFLDAFARAVHDNKADSFSTSWGEWEFFDSTAGGDQVTDEFSHETVSSLQALHEVLVVAALQGQTTFAAAGDCGAYDVFDEVPANFSTPLSVDNPASDSAIVAAGGTTLPGVQEFGLPDGSTFSINVPRERVWGWDYLTPLCNALGLDPLGNCDIFPAGGGGGVSVFFPMPLYQFGIFGTQLSQPKQSFVDNSTTPPTVDFALPAHFFGRNVPDVSFNADPDTGYSLFYTSNRHGFEVETFGGGTSFVSPQLNGVTALLAQNAGHRLGLLNVALYEASRLGLTQGRHPVINTISTGDNWFYKARDGYSPAVGLGTIDVFNLSKVIR
jgi:subtilase family serine protease